MFVFVQPMYSKKELNADSNYVVYSAFIRGMRRVRPDWHFVVAFPDDKSGFKYDDDGFFREPNVSRVPQRISTQKMTNAVSYDGCWYDRLFRTVGFDAIWCNLVEVADKIRHAGDSTFEAGARPICVAAHNYVIHESLPYTWHAMDHVALAQVGGAIMADWNVFNSDHCRKMFLETAEKWFRDELMQDVIARSSRIDYGTLEPSLAPDWNRPANDPPIIAYNHRLQAYKCWTKTFEILDQLYREGVRFRLRFMSNCSDMLSKITSHPWTEVRLCRNRQEYLEALRGCDLNTTNSVHETFCIAAVESMALGQPLIAPDGVTFPEITGRKQLDYPYLFDDTAQQKAMLRRLLTDHEERRQWGQRLSEFVRGRFNQQVWAQSYAELFERLEGKIRLNPQEDAEAFVAETLEKISGCTFPEYIRAIRHKEVGDRVPFSSQSFTFTKAIRIARRLGARIVMDRGVQRVYAKGATPVRQAV